MHGFGMPSSLFHLSCSEIIWNSLLHIESDIKASPYTQYMATLTNSSEYSAAKVLLSFNNRIALPLLKNVPATACISNTSLAHVLSCEDAIAAVYTRDMWLNA